MSCDSVHDIGSGECVGTLGRSSAGITIPVNPPIRLHLQFFWLRFAFINAPKYFLLLLVSPSHGLY